MAHSHESTRKKEWREITKNTRFLAKRCFGEWALAPPGWAPQRDAGIKGGGHPPLQAQAGARGYQMLLQAA